MTIVDRTEEQLLPAPDAPLRRLVLLAAMCLVLGALGGLFAATATRRQPAAARFVPPREAAYDFQLRNQDGHRTSLADARGKVIALTFIYSTCHDLCPAEGNDIVTAMRIVGGDDVEAYVVSVDPVADTQERVREWLERRELTGKGQYLIGSRDELRPVWIHYGIAPVNATRAESEAAARQTDAFFAANPKTAYAPFRYQTPPQPAKPAPGSEDPYPDPSDLAYRGRARHAQGWDFEHSAYVMLIDKHGTQRLGIPFESLTPESLAQDMRDLLSES